MLLSISSMWLRATLSAPIPFWLFLFVLSLGLFTAVELYRYWKISSDLRKRNDALESQRKNAEAHEKALEASKEKLEATIREVRTEKQHLQQQFAELQAEKHRQEQQIAELTSRGAATAWRLEQLAELLAHGPQRRGAGNANWRTDTTDVQQHG